MESKLHEVLVFFLTTYLINLKPICAWHPKFGEQTAVNCINDTFKNSANKYSVIVFYIQ